MYDQNIGEISRKILDIVKKNDAPKRIMYLDNSASMMVLCVALSMMRGNHMFVPSIMPAVSKVSKLWSSGSIRPQPDLEGL